MENTKKKHPCDGCNDYDSESMVCNSYGGGCGLGHPPLELTAIVENIALPVHYPKQNLALIGTDDRFMQFAGLSNEIKRLAHSGLMETQHYSVRITLTRAAAAIDLLLAEVMELDKVRRDQEKEEINQ